MSDCGLCTRRCLSQSVTSHYSVTLGNWMRVQRVCRISDNPLRTPSFHSTETSGRRGTRQGSRASPPVAPGQQDGCVVVQRVAVSLHVDTFLPLAEAPQGVVRVVCDLEVLLGRERSRQACPSSGRRHLEPDLTTPSSHRRLLGGPARQAAGTVGDRWSRLGFGGPCCAFHTGQLR